mmetsp:Transcript_58287/g.69581  ORF Transcript_58287/g.69581 Transcript_58287/m.69581 type:complete len:257 (+) Transcript_58287:1338-2108(+)
MKWTKLSTRRKRRRTKPAPKPLKTKITIANLHRQRTRKNHPSLLTQTNELSGMPCLKTKTIYSRSPYPPVTNLKYKCKYSVAHEWSRPKLNHPNHPPAAAAAHNAIHPKKEKEEEEEEHPHPNLVTQPKRNDPKFNLPNSNKKYHKTAKKRNEKGKLKKQTCTVSCHNEKELIIDVNAEQRESECPMLLWRIEWRVYELKWKNDQGVDHSTVRSIGVSGLSIMKLSRNRLIYKRFEIKINDMNIVSLIPLLVTLPL